MIGHSDISMTDRYSHLSLTHKLLKQDRLAEHYSKEPLNKNPELVPIWYKKAKIHKNHKKKSGSASY